MVLGVIACFVALCGLSLSLWNWLDSKNNVRKHEFPGLLKQSAADLSREYETRLRGLEVEWDDMYAKFARLAGRMDRQKALAPPPPPAPEAEVLPVLSHSDLLRRRRALK